MVIEYRTEINDSYRTIVIKDREIEYGTNCYDNPKDIVMMMNSIFRLDRLSEEYAYMLCLNTKCHLIGVFEISHGTVNASFVSPRDVFMKALLVGACRIVIVHNHPSGDNTMSNEDYEISQKLKKSAEMIGVELLDFLIIGRDSYTSFEEIKIL